MTYPNGAKVLVRNTPNVENGEEGLVVGYYHAGPLLKVDFGGKVVFCSAENCTDVVGTTKDEKIKEVMELVEEFEVLIEEAAILCELGKDESAKEVYIEAVVIKKAVESKLRELIQ